jgi:fermentation-respiration switch protein FrsA (DUF1100 family)
MRILFSIFVLCGLTGCWSQPRTGSATAKSNSSPQYQSPMESENTSTQAVSKPTPTTTSDSKSPKLKPTLRSLDEMLLFQPSKYPQGDWEPAGLDYEDVWFNSADSTKLHAWYCPSEKPIAVILFAHGNGGHLAHRADLLKYLQTELNVSVMMFDYRGYGRSEGVPTVKGVLEDARAASRTLAEQAGISEQELVVMGRSLGGAVAIDLATETNPRALIVESTFPSMKEVASVHYSKIAWIVSAGKLNSINRISEYQGPLLQSHGTADKVIPFELGQQLFAAANEPKEFVIITNGTHNSPQGDEYYETLSQFFGKLENR